MNNGRRVELDVTYNNAPFAGQVGAASFNNLGVHFHQVNALHTVIAGQFLYDTAVPRTDD